ncbi:uncharacterized [Tachysurus ichikawai]
MKAPLVLLNAASVFLLRVVKLVLCSESRRPIMSRPIRASDANDVSATDAPPTAEETAHFRHNIHQAQPFNPLRDC